MGPGVLHYLHAFRMHGVLKDDLYLNLRLLETLVARIVVAQSGLSPLRSRMMAVMAHVDRSVDPNVLAEYLRTGTVLPSDDAIKEALKEKTYYGKGSDVTGNQLGAIFRGIERERSGAAANPLPYGSKPSDMTVEHVFPQSQAKRALTTWKSDFSWGATPADQATMIKATQAAVDAIGNLTLITFSANSKISNKAFSIKKEALAGRVTKIPHPPLWVNHDIVASAKWTFDEIDDRRDTLETAILERWPIAVAGKALDKLFH
jgi:hypothetical protein